MPVENEKKVLLNLNTSEATIYKIAAEIFHIEQAYMLRDKELTVRIRKQIDRMDNVKHYLTVKTKVDDKLIEIEKKISQQDFVHLSKKAAGWVEKSRYVVGLPRENPECWWDIDFFKSGLDTYFVMAEIELPDGVAEPAYLPEFVQDNLLYSVPRTDNRFSSKKLSSVEYATKLLDEIMKGAV